MRDNVWNTNEDKHSILKQVLPLIYVLVFPEVGEVPRAVRILIT